MTYDAFSISSRYAIRDLKELIEEGFCHNECFFDVAGGLWNSFFRLAEDKASGNADDVDEFNFRKKRQPLREVSDQGTHRKDGLCV